MSVEIPTDHPRFASLRVREELILGWKRGVVADSGLIAHGRGEAFDYLLGEKTIPPALKATRVAAAYLLLAERPVISVNGNAAALVADGLVNLSRATGAALEVNIFYRSRERLKAIAGALKKSGAKGVLGLSDTTTIPELSSRRRIVDRTGIFAADVVLVPLEDGDRVEALRRMGKAAIAIDLNPLSRTSQKATVTIVDNITRAVPNLSRLAEGLRREAPSRLRGIVRGYDNRRNLGASIAFIDERLRSLARTGGKGGGPVPRRRRK